MTLDEYAKTIIFPIGDPNDAYAQYFSGKSWLAPVSKEQVFIANVTFEPGCAPTLAYSPINRQTTCARI